MNNNITTYYPKHTLVEDDTNLPENINIFKTTFGDTYEIFTLARVTKEGEIDRVLNYSPVGFDLARKNFLDALEDDNRTREIISVHTMEGIHEDYVFFRKRYYHPMYISDRISLGNSGRVGLRGCLGIDLEVKHDAEPFVNILWELHKLYDQHYENPRRTLELMEKFIVRSKR